MKGPIAGDVTNLAGTCVTHNDPRPPRKAELRSAPTPFRHHTGGAEHVRPGITRGKQNSLPTGPMNRPADIPSTGQSD